MTHRFINTLADGEQLDEVFLLGDKQLRANRNAETYLLVDLRDRTGTISARMWNVNETQCVRFNTGDFVRVKGKVQLYQGALQLIINQIHFVPVDGQDLANYIRQSERDLSHLETRLREILMEIAEGPLRSLMECFLNDEALMQKFAASPAGTKAHHAYCGGLLEHVTNMAEVVLRVADLFPGVNRDLLLAGVFLHDIGKTRELNPDNMAAYTEEGQLIGHLVIGVEMLNDKIAETVRQLDQPFPEEMALRLKHMLLSHHGLYEFGSPRLPMTPEAIALHYIDNLDAKLHEFVRDITDDPNPQASFTPFNARLDRKLFKGLRTPAPAKPADPVPTGP